MNFPVLFDRIMTNVAQEFKKLQKKMGNGIPLFHMKGLVLWAIELCYKRYDFSFDCYQFIEQLLLTSTDSSALEKEREAANILIRLIVGTRMVPELWELSIKPLAPTPTLSQLTERDILLDWLKAKARKPELVYSTRSDKNLPFYHAGLAERGQAGAHAPAVSR